MNSATDTFSWTTVSSVVGRLRWEDGWGGMGVLGGAPGFRTQTSWSHLHECSTIRIVLFEIWDNDFYVKRVQQNRHTEKALLWCVCSVMTRLKVFTGLLFVPNTRRTAVNYSYLFSE